MVKFGSDFCFSRWNKIKVSNEMSNDNETYLVKRKIESKTLSSHDEYFSRKQLLVKYLYIFVVKMTGQRKIKIIHLYTLNLSIKYFYLQLRLNWISNKYLLISTLFELYSADAVWCPINLGLIGLTFNFTNKGSQWYILISDKKKLLKN